MSRGLGRLQRTIVRMLADARGPAHRSEYDGEMTLAEIKAALWGRGNRYEKAFIDGRYRITEARGRGRLLATRSQATQAKQAIDALEARGLVQWIRWNPGKGWGGAYWLAKLTAAGKSLASESRDLAARPAAEVADHRREDP